ERFRFAAAQARPSPLGAGALAGSTLPLPPPAEPMRNSIDAVSDRDFALDYLYAVAVCFGHLSRIGEELVLWTTSEFGFARLPESAATGSSMMPQKLNADVAELARGKAGTAIGRLAGLLATVKGLPLAYNRDLQEDKEPLFDAVDTSLATLGILADVVRRLRFDVSAMRRAASDPMLLATDVAEHLVARGMPFREAHSLVGAAVRRCVAEKRTLAELSVEEWRQLSDRFDGDVVALFDVDAALRRRELPGGPGPRTVGRALTRAATAVARTRRLANILAG
ncbi:MAG: argininosuccinate lyase, partial [Candidatus Dormibacteria bacterium]